MKKDCTRDYVTAIFRRYSAAGLPEYDTERERIYNQALAEQTLKDPSKAVIRAEKAVESATPYLLDILAAESTVKTLEDSGRGYIAGAVKAVYCTGRYLSNKEIASRVRRYALNAHADERTVYRWLRTARLLCAAYRGLTVSENDVCK